MCQLRVLLLFLRVVTGLEQTPVFDSINKCCSLGSYRAKAQVDESCDEIAVPVKDIIPEMQATCLSTMEVCCTKTRIQLQCEAGRVAALSGAECSLPSDSGMDSDDRITLFSAQNYILRNQQIISERSYLQNLVSGEMMEGREAYKDCCLSCTLGIVVASMGQKCSGVANIFGCPLEQPFLECCQEIAAPLMNFTDDNSDLCPDGFKYNSEMHVCYDIDEVLIRSDILSVYMLFLV